MSRPKAQDALSAFLSERWEVTTHPSKKVAARYEIHDDSGYIVGCCFQLEDAEAIVATHELLRVALVRAEHPSGKRPAPKAPPSSLEAEVAVPLKEQK